MGFESIKSDEKVPLPVATQGERPKHTQTEHKACAFYPQTVAYGPDELPMFIGLFCPHNVKADGAFYSEDYIFDLKHAAHVAIAHLEGSGIINNSSGAVMKEAQRYLSRLKELTR